MPEIGDATGNRNFIGAVRITEKDREALEQHTQAVIQSCPRRAFLSVNVVQLSLDYDGGARAEWNAYLEKCDLDGHNVSRKVCSRVRNVCSQP